MSPRWGGADGGDTNPSLLSPEGKASTSVALSFPRYSRFSFLMFSSSVISSPTVKASPVTSWAMTPTISSFRCSRLTFCSSSGSS